MKLCAAETLTMSKLMKAFETYDGKWFSNLNQATKYVQDDIK